MFDTLAAIAARRAKARVEERARELADKAREALPADVRVEADAAGVKMSGKALAARLLLEAGLRFLLARLK